MPAPLQPRTLRKLSLVFPIYNEEETLPYLRAEIDRWMREFNARRPEATVEIILVDDGSTDNSLQNLIAWCAEEPRVRGHTRQEQAQGAQGNSPASPQQK